MQRADGRRVGGAVLTGWWLVYVGGERLYEGKSPDTLIRLGIVFAALLLANLRATSLASGWKLDSEEAALPPRLNETWGDKFADQLPVWLWPKIRIPYYIFSLIFMLLVALGLSIAILRRMR